MRVIAAPDSFKGTITAAAAAAAIAAGWRSARPGDEVVEMPLADGGEGTLDVLAASRAGCRRDSAQVTGPGPDRRGGGARVGAPGPRPRDRPRAPRRTHPAAPAAAADRPQLRRRRADRARAGRRGE